VSRENFNNADHNQKKFIIMFIYQVVIEQQDKPVITCKIS